MKTMARIEDLVLDDRNARRGKVELIAESLRRYGQKIPVIVEKNSNKVVKGNHTVKAAALLGWEEVWVEYDDSDPELLREFALADNRCSDEAGWDDTVLVELSMEIDLAEIPGFDEDFVEELRRLAEDTKPMPVDTKEAPRKGQNIDLKRGPTVVRVLVRMDRAELVERALRATGKANRAVALEMLCRRYLEAQGLAEEVDYAH